MADKKLLPQAECVTIAVSNANHSDPSAAPMFVHNGNGKAATADDKYSALSETPPPDGGTRAWCVMVSAFLCNSILFGIINTCGTIYLQLQEGLELTGDSEASSKAGKFALTRIQRKFVSIDSTIDTLNKPLLSSFVLFCFLLSAVSRSSFMFAYPNFSSGRIRKLYLERSMFHKAVQVYFESAGIEIRSIFVD